MSPATPTQLAVRQQLNPERRHKIRTLPFLDHDNPLRELIQSNDREGLEEALSLAEFEKDDVSENGKLLRDPSADGLHVLLEWAVVNDAVECMEGLLDWADRVSSSHSPSSSTDNDITSPNPKPDSSPKKSPNPTSNPSKPPNKPSQRQGALIPYSAPRLYTTARLTALQTGHLSCLIHLHDCDTQSRVFGDPTELYLNLLATKARSPGVVDRLARRLPPPPETDYRGVLVQVCGDAWVQPGVVERVLGLVMDGREGRKGRDRGGYDVRDQGSGKGKEKEQGREWTDTRWMAEAVGRAAECGAVSTVEVLIRKGGLRVFGEVKSRGPGQVEEVMKEGGNPLVRLLGMELPGEPTWEDAVAEWEKQRERQWGVGGRGMKVKGDVGVSDVHVNTRDESGRDGKTYDEKRDNNEKGGDDSGQKKTPRRIDAATIQPATTLWRRRTRHTATSMRHLTALLTHAALNEFQDPGSAHFTRGDAERLRLDMLHHAAIFFVRRVRGWLLENLPWLLIMDRRLKERLLVPVPVSPPGTPTPPDTSPQEKPKYTFSPHWSGIAARHLLITHQIEIPLPFLEIWAMLMTETTARRAIEEDGFGVHPADFRGGSESGDVLWALIMAQEGGDSESEGDDGEEEVGVDGKGVSEEREVVERVVDEDCPAAKWAPGII